MRKLDFSIDEFYHLYNRGTDKRHIFLDSNDYERFVKLLYLCNSDQSIVFREIPIGQAYGKERGDTLVDIGAYCLMPNHFHLLIREKQEGGTQKFMLKLLTAYSMYFNKKNSRTGALFESRFKAKHVDTDEYLKYLLAYIHLNPVKIIDPEWKENGIANRREAKDYIVNYKHSSFLEYVDGSRQEGKIINRAVFPEYFVGAKDFEAFIEDWMSFCDL